MLTTLTPTTTMWLRTQPGPHQRGRCRLRGAAQAVQKRDGPGTPVKDRPAAPVRARSQDAWFAVAALAHFALSAFFFFFFFFFFGRATFVP
jgi:hypothetical protein